MSTELAKTTPSLIHALSQYANTPAQTASNLIFLKENPPKIRTFDARFYLEKLFLGMAPASVLRQAELEPRKTIRKTALEILPLGIEYLDIVRMDWFRPIGELRFKLSPKWDIPIKLLGVGKVDGQIKAIFAQTWKTKSPSASQFNAWASVVLRTLREQMPEVTDFDWLEMSSPHGSKTRKLIVRSSDAARLFDDDDFVEFLSHFETALAIVDRHFSGFGKSTKRPDPDQGDFFK